MRLYYSIFQSPQQVILTKRGVQKITVILAPSAIMRLGGIIRDSTVVLELVILIPVEFTPEPSSTVLL